MRMASGVQHLLPVVLLVAAILELIAVATVQVDALDVGGAASVLGPSAFLPLSLAVVWAAFLTPSRPALVVKAITAGGAAGFLAARLVLSLAWWTGRTTAGWTASALIFASILLGVALLVWCCVDLVATRAALSATRTLTRSPASPAVSAAESSPSGPPEVRAAAHPPTQPAWQSVSTPWPRRDESDPDGTVIRPPRRQRQQRRRA